MKIFKTLLCLLVVSAYAGCAYNQPQSSTLSYISFSQQVPSQTNNSASQESVNSANQPQNLPMRDVTMSTPDGQVAFHSQVADTPASMMKGLMFRDSMPQNEGMIFIFDHEQPLTFWMKDTLIPLDMIFVNKDWKIVSIQKNAQPCKADPCKTYPSGVIGQYVLEINAGLSDKLGIQVGAMMKLL